MKSTPGTSNIAAHLPEMARNHPQLPAVHFPRGQHSTQYSFQELDQQSNRLALGLEAVGIGRGTRTVLLVPPSPDFFALTFALFKVGAVPVLIDPGMGVKNLKACLEEAEPEAFIGNSKAHLARLLLGWGRATIRTLVTCGPRLCWGGHSLAQLLAVASEETDYAMAVTSAEETAAILFTSGSTGSPKGAVYSHGNFCAQVEMLRELYDIRPGEIDLPTFPLFALFAPALGMTSVIPEMDFTRPGSVDPRNIIKAIEKFQVTSMFGSPALINRVGRYGQQQGIKLPTLRRVISAGAPVPASVLERFAAMLPATAEVFTPYGATEALPVCSIGSRQILEQTRALTEQGHGVCVGPPVAGIELHIIAIDDGPIPCWDAGLKVADGQIGEIVVKGPQVTARYFNRPKADALAKIRDPAGGFFHRMGDLGYRDEAGRIWFCGRKAHRVISPDQTRYSIPCEAIFNTHPQVYRSALVGVGARHQQRPVICIELEKGVKKSTEEQIRRELLDLACQYAVTTGIRELLFHPAFPVDIRHNAKIFREKLAVWAQKELS